MHFDNQVWRVIEKEREKRISSLSFDILEILVKGFLEYLE